MLKRVLKFMITSHHTSLPRPSAGVEMMMCKLLSHCGFKNKANFLKNKKQALIIAQDDR